MQLSLKLAVLGFLLMECLMAATYTTTFAQADDPQCRTFNECYELKAKIEAQIKELKTPPKLSDIAKNADGSVLKMTQREAKKYCMDMGLRLPTVREMGLYSQSLGARGIRETAYAGVASEEPTVRREIARMKENGYYVIFTENVAGETSVDFYFSESGYKSPGGEFGRYDFWSSSILPNNHRYAHEMNNDGQVAFVMGVTADLAVRCVLSGGI